MRRFVFALLLVGCASGNEPQPRDMSVGGNDTLPADLALSGGADLELELGADLATRVGVDLAPESDDLASTEDLAELDDLSSPASDMAATCGLVGLTCCPTAQPCNDPNLPSVCDTFGGLNQCARCGFLFDPCCGVSQPCFGGLTCQSNPEGNLICS
jgi:hypothetical protein